MKPPPIHNACALILIVAVVPMGIGSSCLLPAGTCTDETTVWIKLANDSATQYVAPNIGICPNGMASQPHHFVATPPVLGPGEEVTYTSCQIAGSDGNCLTFATDFAIGLCGWQYGAAADNLESATKRFGGQIGTQFNCGDTVTLRWSDAGDTGGTWTSEVQPATGNPTPTADFQEL